MKQFLLAITIFVFLTGVAMAQTVTSISPSLNSDDVAVTSNITINFSEGMDNATITSSTVIISGSMRGLYSGSFSYGATSATFDPDDSFFPGEFITVVVTEDVKDAGGDAITAPYRTTFTTATSGDGEFSVGDEYTADGSNFTDWSITADINEDGYIDIITLVPSQNKMSIFTNDGDGTFSGPTNYTTANSFQVEAKDVDQDGSLDLVTSNNNAFMMSVFINNGSGSGTFASKVDYANGSSWNGKALTTGDIDNDGDEDVLVDIIIGGAVDSVQIFLNDGDGTFTVADGISTTDGFEQIKLWDIDGDEDLDFVGVSPGLGQLVTYRNDGSGSFSLHTTSAITSSSYQFILANFKSSSADIEAITVDQSDDVVRYLGDGIPWAFGASPATINVGDTPVGIASGDLDGDGHIDVVVSNAIDMNLSILMNDGTPSFTESNYSTGSTYANFISLADVDNDGDLDIVMGNQDGTIKVAFNFSGPAVTSITPANGLTEIASNDSIIVVFNEAMKASTLNSTNVTVVGTTAGTITASYSYDSNDSTLTITPNSDFILGDEITVTITTNVTSDAGVAITSSATSTFDIEGVNVQSTAPSANATGVSVSSNIDITFNDTMDNTTLTTSNILVFGSLSGSIPGSISINSNTVTFNPTDDFIPGEEVSIVATSGIENSSDVAMDGPNVIRFKVQGSVGYITHDDTVKSVGQDPSDIVIMDVDVDGYLDLVITNGTDNTVSIMLNDGSGGYSSATTLATGSYPSSIVAGDFDNQNGMDFVVTNYSDNDIRVFTNNGSGTFSTADYAAGSGAVDAVVADFDGDGYLDIAVHNRSAGNEQIFLNDGDGTFTSAGTISTTSNMNRIFAADLDNDDDIDIISGGAGYGLYTSLNNGDATFAAAISTSIPSYDVEFVDLNGNNYLDLVVSDYNSNEVSVHLNDGDGTFGVATNYTVSKAHELSIVDVNDDGDMDIVALNFSEKSGQVLVNGGSGTFTTGQTFDVGATPDRMEFADLNEDGQMDFVSVARTEDAISINYGTEYVEVSSFTPTENAIDVSSTANITATFNDDMDSGTLTDSTVLISGSNSGLISGVFTYDGPSKTMTFNPDNAFKAGEKINVIFSTGIKNSNGSALTIPTQFTFTAEASGVGYFSYAVESSVFPNSVSSLFGADLDGDGDQDMVGLYNLYMSVRINDGSGTYGFGTATDYFMSGGGASILPADLDNDGDVDMLAMRGNSKYLVFMENDGSGTFSRKDSISTNQVVSGGRWTTGDFNNDGNIDVAIIDQGVSNYALYIYTNDGDMNFSSYYQSDDFDDSASLTSADLDNDGDLDFILSERYEYYSVILSNGDGTYGSETTYAAPNGSYTRATVGDFDGDGYMDIAIANQYSEDGNSFSIRLNDGDGTFGDKTDHATTNDNYWASTGDMDGDGDLDIIIGKSNSLSIAFNDGSGGIDEVVDYSITGSNIGTAIFDYDGDGDLDIVNPAYPNLSYLTNEAPTTPSSEVTSLTFSNNYGEQITTNWSNGDGTGRLVLAKQGSAVDATPTDDTFYTADDFGIGTQLGTGNYVVYAGSSNSADIAGLTVNTTYHFAVFEYNKGGTEIKYLTSSPATGNVTTAEEPTTSATSVAFSVVKDTRMTISWTNGDGQNRIVLVKEAGAVDGTPSDNTSYSESTEFGEGAEIGSGNYVVYNGNGSSVTVTGLTAETTYHVSVFEFNGTDGMGRFKTTFPAIGNSTTMPTPAIWSKNDSTLVFTKANFGDHNQAANQDRITENIWLTRAGSGYLFNYADELEDGDNSPAGTQWALGTTDSLSTLTFQSFSDLWSGNASNIPGNDMVAYLEADNVYLDINFSSWTSGSSNGGGFSYTRAKGPEPTPIIQSFQDSAGFAYKFDGGDTEYYMEAYLSDYAMGNQFSVEMWVKPDSVGIDQVFLELYSELYVGINSSNKFYATHSEPNAGSGGGEEYVISNNIKSENQNGRSLVASKAELADNTSNIATKDEWYHVALTGESGGLLTLYVNGVAVDTTSVSDVTIDEQYWYIGSDYDEDKYFYGTVDELRIWKSVRTASQIRSFMHTPYTGAVGRLVAYWQFNEGTGGSSFDGLNNYEAESYNSDEASWTSSDVPIGDGTVEETSDFQSGTANIGNASLTMADGFDNPVDVQVTEVEGNPNQFPSGFTSGLGGKYFVINLFGDPGTFSANLTLTYGSGVITATQQSNPNLVKLYKRGSNSTGAWSEIASATSAVEATGVVTWTGITSFSQFMAVTDTLTPFSLELADGADVVSYKDSAYTFESSFFQLVGTYTDSALTINSKSTLNGSLYLDQNSNGDYDIGTDSLLTSGKELTYTPSGSVKLRYASSTIGVESAVIKLQTSQSADSVSLDFFTAEGSPSLAGTADENGWYLLSNPFTTSLGDLLDNIWTQGAPNSDAPGGDATLFTFSQDSSKYVAISTDLDTTKLAAGTGLLAYIFADDDNNSGTPLVNNGWPKTLTNYGNPFGTDVSVTIKNVDHDGLSGTSGSEGFALLGNPYGWPLSADSVIATIKREDALANSYVYRWNPVEKQYQLVTTGAIEAYESFFVRIVTSGATANLSFDYDDADIADPSKKVANNPFELILTHSKSGFKSRSYLRFDEKASDGIDPFDGYYLGSYARNYSNLYTQVNDQRLTINNIPSNLDQEVEFPMYIDGTLSGEYDLVWNSESLPKDFRFILTEVATGTEIDLATQNSYSFSDGLMAKKVITKEATSKSVDSDLEEEENIDGKTVSSELDEDVSVQLLDSQSEKSATDPKVEAKAKASSSDALFVLKITPLLASGNENEDGLGIPTTVELEQNYPNPFNPTSVIRFGVPNTAEVQLEVFDVLGRKVMTLINNETKQAGRYNVQFEARNLATGMYIYRLVIGDKILTKKMLLIK